MRSFSSLTRQALTASLLAGSVCMRLDEAQIDQELQRNVLDHEADGAQICASYFCGPVKAQAPVDTSTYPLGMKSVDFADEVQQ